MKAEGYPARGRAPARPPAARVPARLVLAGEERDTRPIREALRPLPLPLEERAGLEIERDLGAAALVVAAPRGTRVERRVGAVRKEHAELPLFVVLPGDAPDAAVVRLYRHGATAVFGWPLAREILPWVVADLLGVGFPASQPTDTDRALERAIRARLRVLGRAGRGLRISARGGVVS